MCPHARAQRRRQARLRLRRQRQLALLVLLVLLAGGMACASLAALSGPELAQPLRLQPRLMKPVEQTGASAAPTSLPTSLPAPQCPLPAALRPLFEAAAADSGLPVALLSAVAYVESRFIATAESPVGAFGLMQLMPETAAALEVDPTDPAANVLGGARYLHEMLHRFGQLDLALAAYNAGPTIVARVGGPPYEETRDYVDAVRGRYYEQQGCH